MMDETKIYNKAMKPTKTNQATELVKKSCYICGYNKLYPVDQIANCPNCNKPIKTNSEWRELVLKKIESQFKGVNK